MRRRTVVRRLAVACVLVVLGVLGATAAGVVTASPNALASVVVAGTIAFAGFAVLDALLPRQA